MRLCCKDSSFKKRRLTNRVGVLWKAESRRIREQMGRTEDTGREEVVTILFDKSRFTEEQAAGWWRGNRCRFTLSKPLD